MTLLDRCIEAVRAARACAEHTTGTGSRAFRGVEDCNACATALVRAVADVLLDGEAIGARIEADSPLAGALAHADLVRLVFAARRRVV